MAVTESTYYGFTRVREASPEAQDWSTVDGNWETVSKILRYFEQHTHNGADTLQYPGYDPLDIPNPTPPVLTEGTDGFLTPGTVVGVVLSYVDGNGLETQGCPELAIELSAATDRPLTPEFDPDTGLTAPGVGENGLAGGTYLYGITKVKGSGETEISDLLPVDIPYDANYNVTITFESIDSYDLGEGVEALNIYRSEGLDSAFTLVDQITIGTDTDYTDTGTYDVSLVGVQPPQTSTFDSTKSVLIDWSDIDTAGIPADATKLRVYVTQETHLWGDTHLLAEIDLATYTGPPDSTSIVYTGSEALGAGWPRATSQIPSSSSKINLSTETTGGLNLNADSDFQGYRANNLRLGLSPTVTKTAGMLWYDSAAQALILRGTSADITVASISGVYTHPAESSGGHIAANIPYSAGSGTSAKTIFDYTTAAGARKQVQEIDQYIPSTSGVSTTSTSYVYCSNGYVDLMVVELTPKFNNQVALINWDGVFAINYGVSTAYADFDIEVTATGGSPTSWTQSAWARRFPAPYSGASFTAQGSLVWSMPSTSYTYYFLLRWRTTTGVLSALTNQRQITAVGAY